jgi:hypothetical protein
MNTPYNIITILHDPDNQRAMVLVDHIYALLMPHSVGISTTWNDGIEEHRFEIPG